MAMAEGSGELKHLNTVLHGPPGSGKSSLKRAILGEDPLSEEKQISTDIMKNAVRAVSMDRLKSFTIITNEHLVDLLAEAMLNNNIKKVKGSKSVAADSGNKPLANVSANESKEIKQQTTVHDEHSLRDIEGPTNTSASSQIKNPDENKSTAADSGNKPLANVTANESNEMIQQTLHDNQSLRDIAGPTNTSTSNQSKNPDENKSTAADSGNKPLANVSANESNEIIQQTVHDEQSLRNIDPPNTSASKGSSSESVSPTLSKIRDRLKNGKFSSNLFNSDWHHLIDSGGQLQYQDIFPFLYKSPSFQIVLMRLIDGLDEKLPNCYTIKGKNTLEQLLQLTNRQYIEKMCQIAASANPPSKVMIVGTHKDKLGDDAEAKIEKLNQALKDIKKKYGKVLICKSDDEIIFDINTMAKGKERQEYTQKLQEIMREVFEELATPTTVPFRWLAFQLDISKGNGVVNMDYCHKSGKAVGMKVAAIKSALMYLNKAALLLYYPNDIPDVVLTSVDPLVSKLSLLVKSSFITPKRTLRELCERLRNRGIFNFQFLEEVEICHNVKDTPQSALENELFLKFLVCLRIAVHIGNDEYFLPSALSLDQPCEKLPAYTCSCVPVGFLWKDSDDNDRFLPHGFFFTVAVEFLGTSINNFAYKLCDRYQCRQEIVFEGKSNSIPGLVTLTDRNTWMQVSTNISEPAELKKYCPHIFKSVKNAIEKAMALFEHTTRLDPPNVVSLCTIHPNSAHYCTPSHDKKSVTCSKSKTSKPAPADMLCWMSESKLCFCIAHLSIEHHKLSIRVLNSKASHCFQVIMFHCFMSNHFH